MFLFRLILKEWILIFICFICLFVMLICNAKLSLFCQIEWHSFIKEAFNSIAGSFIAGYLFYIFSVLLPKSKKLPPVLGLSCQQIRYAKEGLDEKSHVICYKDAKEFMLNAKNETCGSYELTQMNCRYILQAVKDVNMFIQYPMSKVEYLDNEDVKRLSKTAQLVTKSISRLSDALQIDFLSSENIKIIGVQQPGKAYLDDKDVAIIKEIATLLEEIYNNLKKYELK